MLIMLYSFRPAALATPTGLTDFVGTAAYTGSPAFYVSGCLMLAEILGY